MLSRNRDAADAAMAIDTLESCKSVLELNNDAMSVAAKVVKAGIDDDTMRLVAAVMDSAMATNALVDKIIGRESERLGVKIAGEG